MATRICVSSNRLNTTMPSGMPTTSPATGTIHFSQSNASRTLHQTRALLTTAVAVKMIDALDGDRNSGISPIDTWAKPNPAMPWTTEAIRITTVERPVVIQLLVIDTAPGQISSRTFVRRLVYTPDLGLFLIEMRNTVAYRRRSPTNTRSQKFDSNPRSPFDCLWIGLYHAEFVSSVLD
jgi:hypothetical protein